MVGTEAVYRYYSSTHKENMENPESYLPIGTDFANYASGKSGPFRCGNCQHFEAKDRECYHPIVQADVGVPHNKEGEAVVDPNGCCTYFSKRG